MCRVRRKRPRLEEVVLALGQAELPWQGHTCPTVGSRPKSGLEAHLGLVPHLLGWVTAFPAKPGYTSSSAGLVNLFMNRVVAWGL